MFPWHVVVIALAGWINREQDKVIGYLREKGKEIGRRAFAGRSESQYIASYCERTGREKIEHWDFYLAYNLFRIAAILQGVMKRGLDGTAASAEALDAGARAGPLAELGWRYAEKAMGSRSA